MAKGGKGGGDIIRGNKWDNSITGTLADEVIDGRGGNDTLDGAGGNDTLLGGEGNDTLIAGLGDDSIAGDSGDDTIIFSGSRADYTVVQIDAGTVEISGPDGTDTITGVETFTFADISQTFAEVLIPYLPNVTAGPLMTGDADVISGEGVYFEWTVSSDGYAPADDSVTTLVIATAPDMGSVVESFGFAQTGPLASGESGLFNGVLDTTGFTPGTYYVAAVADGDNQLEESDETDNVTNWIEVTIAPQVVSYSVQDVTVLPESDFNLNSDPNDYHYGARLYLDTTFVNDSNVGPTQFRMVTYLSKDAVLSYDDYDIDTYEAYIGYGETVRNVGPVDINEYFPAGEYYVITTIQQTSYSEPFDDESDNIFVTSEPITLVGGWTYGTEESDVFVGTYAMDFFEGFGGDDQLLNAGANDVFLGGAGYDFVDYSSLTTGVGVYYDQYYSPGGLMVYEVNPDPYGDPYTQNGGLEDVESVRGTELRDEIVIEQGSVREIVTLGGDDAVVGSFWDDIIDTGTGDDIIAALFGDDLMTTGDGFDQIYVERKADGHGGYTGHGHDTITDFDPYVDMLFIELNYGETFDVAANLTQEATGTRLTLADDSSVFFLGVAASQINEFNVQSYGEDLGVYY